MDNLNCTWAEFKAMVKEFHDNAPTLNLEELDNAWKCLGLGYLNMSEEMWRHSASIALQIETKVFLNREDELMKEIK